MSMFITPDKIYFKNGCLDIALDELKTVYGSKRAMIVVDKELRFCSGVSAVMRKMDGMHIQHCCFCVISEKPTAADIESGAAAMRLFEPDTIIAAGSSSVIEAAKMMRVKYDNPETDILSAGHSVDALPVCRTLLVTIPLLLDSVGCIVPNANFISDNEELNVKDDQLIPGMTVIDPLLICSQTPEELNSFRNAAAVLAYMIYIGCESDPYAESFAFKALDILLNELPEEFTDSPEHAYKERLCEVLTAIGIAYSNDPNQSDVPLEPSFSDRSAELASALGITGGNDMEKSLGLIKKLKLL